jgi:hypothetical protein
VKCLAIDETPELIDLSLHELQIEIDNIIPHIGKNAYLQSQLTAKGRSFVNSKEFKLRFLRYELFDIQKTAVRMLKWLELALSLFGSVALERPICLSTDFSSLEQQLFRKGCIQLLPVRAFGTGRRIMCFIPYDEDWYKICENVRQKIMMYTFWIVGNDIDAQRKGVIVIVLFDSSFHQKPDQKGAGVVSPSYQWILSVTLSVRMSAIHICTPDTPFFRLSRSLIAMAMGSHNRARLKLHLGTAVELRYKLQVYGIPIDCIPLTYTGKIKLTYARQWLKIRNMIEDKEKLTTCTATTTNCNNSTNSDSNILVEAPYLNDVLFKQGNSFTSHPGNNTLRSLIESKVKQYHESAKDYKPNALNRVERKALILQIMDEFEHTYRGRFVNWHKSSTMSDYWWVILHNSNGNNSNDQKLIFNKVEPLFRKIHTKIQQQYQQLSQKILFDQNMHMKQQERIHKTMSTADQNSSNSIQYNNSNNDSSMMNIDDDDPPPITITTVSTINQNGGTFLFHSLDGNGKNNNNNNNTRGGLLSLHHTSDNNRAITSSLSSECFGMKFVPCYD